jgi:hypothetical protein
MNNAKQEIHFLVFRQVFKVAGDDWVPHIIDHEYHPRHHNKQGSLETFIMTGALPIRTIRQDPPKIKNRKQDLLLIPKWNKKHRV